MSRTIIFAGVATVICFAGNPALGDARGDYASIFGAEARRVVATRATGDDAAFARKLLDSAASVSEAPALQLLLYEKAYDFGAAGPEGTPVALEALGLLAQRLPDRKADWQAKRLALLRNAYTRARGEARKDAGETYAAALAALGDQEMKDKRPDQAVVQYRAARSVALACRMPLAKDLGPKIAEATAAAHQVAKIKALRLRIDAHPEDTTAREELIVLYLVQQDAPSKAQFLLNGKVDSALRINVPLAGRDIEKLTAADCMRLGQWYHQALVPKASGEGRVTALKRAQTYYARFLEVHELRDTARFKAAAALKAVRGELARLSPQSLTPRSSGLPVPKGAVAFGGHHYKVIAARGLSWHAAVKACKKLGGHLATIESAGEMALLIKLAGPGRLWVGLTDEKVEGRWVTVDGKPMSRSFRQWSSGEPNEGRRGNYASVMAGGLRDTSSASQVTGFLCEWDR